MGTKYIKPYTSGGVYNAGSSGLTEAEFRAQRSGNSLAPQNAFHTANSSNYGGGASSPVGQSSPWGWEWNARAAAAAKDPPGSLPGVSSPGAPPALTAGQYTNPGATQGLGTPQVWQGDPNLQHISGAMMQMLGFNPGNGSFDTSSGSLMGGPGQALSKSQLGGLSAKGAMNTGQNQRNATAGAAMAAAGRGTVGPTMSMLLGPQAQAANRGALASADLDAQMKGFDLGNTQYANRANTFGNLLSSANAEQNRNVQTQVVDAQNRQTSKNNQFNLFHDAMQNMAAFANQHATELTQNPGGKGGADILAKNRALMDHLTNIFNQMGGNYNRFAM